MSLLSLSSYQIKEYIPLVKKIAYHMASKLPSSVSSEDLVQSGLIGLVEALRNYDQSKGASFSTYASIRIRGAMIDELRKGDWAPRSVHRSTRELNQAISEVESSTGQPFSLKQVSIHMQLSLDEVSHLIQECHGKKILSFEDISSQPGEALPVFGDMLSPLESTLASQEYQNLQNHLSFLSERERAIVIFYYYHEYSLKNIADIMKISESRVCQIISESLKKLKKSLKDLDSVVTRYCTKEPSI